MDEELKNKYKILFYDVNNINKKLQSVLNKINELNDYLNDTAVIDDKIIEHDSYYSIKNNISGIVNELNNTVLPSLRYKSF